MSTRFVAFHPKALAQRSSWPTIRCRVAALLENDVAAEVSRVHV